MLAESSKMEWNTCLEKSMCSVRVHFDLGCNHTKHGELYRPTDAIPPFCLQSLKRHEPDAYQGPLTPKVYAAVLDCRSVALQVQALTLGACQQS